MCGALIRENVIVRRIRRSCRYPRNPIWAVEFEGVSNRLPDGALPNMSPMAARFASGLVRGLGIEIVQVAGGNWRPLDRVRVTGAAGPVIGGNTSDHRATYDRAFEIEWSGGSPDHCWQKVNNA